MAGEAAPDFDPNFPRNLKRLEVRHQVETVELIEVDQRADWHRGVAPGADLAETATDGESGAALRDGLPNERRGGGAESVPEEEWVTLREHSLAGDGGRHGTA